MSNERCAKCGEEGQDRRTLWMDCMYDMTELGVPLVKVHKEDKNGTVSTYFTLRVCKNCRADWLEAIKDWFNKPVNRESPGTGIYVRRFGSNVELTEAEFNRLQREARRKSDNK